MLLLLVFGFTVAGAQQRSNAKHPKWIPEKGYWVVETSGQDRKQQIIHFYNNDNQLVYRELLTGVSLKTARRNVKMKLKKVLETSIAAWEIKKEQTENLALVARAL